MVDTSSNRLRRSSLRAISERVRSISSTVRRVGARFCSVLAGGRFGGPHVMAESGDNLRFVFEEQRAVQAAALLMRSAGGRMNYTKLLKLLYLADRRSLLETGQPITGSSFVSMAAGPVLSEVYECIKSEPDHGWWDRHIRTEEYNVHLVEDPGDDQLSDYDVGVLTELAEKYKGASYSHMIDVVHALPEWRDPQPNKVRSLPAADVLRAAGEDEETIAEHAQNSSYHAAVRRILFSS